MATILVRRMLVPLTLVKADNELVDVEIIHLVVSDFHGPLAVAVGNSVSANM